jgi:pSer/pThr/pTyr-binding forkhead associated (FHA) protein
MGLQDRREITDFLLEALEAEDEYEGRIRGAEIARPMYYLKEIPLPARQPVVPAAPTPSDTGSRPVAAASAVVEPVVAPATELGHYACPTCGWDNPRSARFCSACGGTLHPSVARSDIAPPHQPPPPKPAPAVVVTLVAINEDGSDGPRSRIDTHEAVLGRTGDVRFPTDAFLSPKHAKVTIEGTKVFIEDLYSLNGTYVKLREEARLTPGDTFLMGRQVLRYERFELQVTPKARASDGTRYMGSPPPGGQFKLLQVGIGGVIQNVYCLHETGAVVGREKGDVIFPRDKFMSSRHAQIYPRNDGHYYLVDLNSSNGTWVKIWDRRQMAAGDFIFLGQQLFRLELS